MDPLAYFGRLFIGLSAISLILGLALTIGGRLPGLGRLPGDFLIKHENFTFYFPLGTSILLSLILTLLFCLFRR